MLFLARFNVRAFSEGWIVDFGYETTKFKLGDSVGAWAIIRNNFDNVSVFYIGFSVKNPSGIWLDAPYVALVLQPKVVSEKVLLRWEAPADAIVGFYAVKIAVWKGTAGQMLAERLDYRESNNAFYITRELPALGYLVNFSFAILPNLLNAFMSKIRKSATIKRLGYNGVFCIGYAVFLWALPNVSRDLIITGYFFEAWGILTILVALNFPIFRKSHQKLIDWIFDYRNPASF
jgi:hypothetical protein